MSQLLFYRGRVGFFNILETLGIGTGDEVIVQAFTCVAVPEAVMATGATPVWADVSPDSVTLDPEDVRAKITTRTKAIMVQHTFGIPAQMDSLMAIARERAIPIIEDCCHCYASTYRGELLGTLGEAAFWSYEWGKPVIAGIGGEARYNRPELEKKAGSAYEAQFIAPPFKRTGVIAAQYLMFSILYGPRRFWPVRKAFRLLGRAGVAQSNYNPVGKGSAVAADFKWRMSGFSKARLASSQTKAGKFTQRRIEQAALYSKGMKAVGVALPAVPEHGNAVYSRFPLLVRNKEELLKAAMNANVELANWYATPVHPLQGQELKLVHYTQGSCPNAEQVSGKLVSLPVNAKVTDAFQRKAIDLIHAHARA